MIRVPVYWFAKCIHPNLLIVLPASPPIAGFKSDASRPLIQGVGCVNLYVRLRTNRSSAFNSEISMQCLPLARFACAAAMSISAVASAAGVTSSVSWVTSTYVDLNPTDGVTSRATFSFQAGNYEQRAYVNFPGGGGSFYPYLVYVDGSTAGYFGSGGSGGSSSTGSSVRFGLGSPQSTNSFTQNPYQLYGVSSATAWVDEYFNVTVTPYTQVTFFLTMTSDGSGASAKESFSIAGATFSDSLYETGSKAVSYTFTTGAAAATGTFYRETSAYANAPPPVPEPETYALMIAGLALVVFVRRR